jgi:predicted O-methyltransferase YrrM
MSIFFNGPKLYTEIECGILQSIINDNNVKNILEIGTFNGYATVHLAQASEHVVSIREAQTLVPSAEENLKLNEVRNTELIETDNITEFIHSDEMKDILSTNSFDMILIDVMQNNPEQIYNAVKKQSELIIFHDAQCEETDEMKVGKFLKHQKEVEIIETVDADDNVNSFAIIRPEKEKKVVPKAKAKKQETKVSE